MINFRIRQKSDVAIVEIKDKITIGSSDEQLLDIVNDLLDAGNKKILLNCGQVTLIDSAGISVLVAIISKVKNRQGKLAVLNLPAHLQEQPELTQLKANFTIYENEDEVLKAMKI